MIRMPALPAGVRGASMIEVLIALTLVAVTMLGLLGLQLRSMGLQKDSLDRRNAAVLVAGFAERIAGNFEGFERNRYTLANMSLAPGATLPTAATCSPCNEQQIAARDWAIFAQQVRTRLPDGIAFIDANRARVLVTVGWLDPQRTTELGAAAADPVCPATVTNTLYRCYVAAVYP